MSHILANLIEGIEDPLFYFVKLPIIMLENITQ